MKKARSVLFEEFIPTFCISQVQENSLCHLSGHLLSHVTEGLKSGQVLFLHLAYFCFLLYLPCINSHLTYHLIIFGQDLTQMSLAFNLFKKINFIFYLYGCFATCVSMHHMHACCLQRPEVGVRSLGNRITDNLSTTWMLGLKCQLSGKAANALKH